MKTDENKKSNQSFSRGDASKEFEEGQTWRKIEENDFFLQNRHVDARPQGMSTGNMKSKYENGRCRAAVGRFRPTLGVENVPENRQRWEVAANQNPRLLLYRWSVQVLTDMHAAAETEFANEDAEIVSFAHSNLIQILNALHKARTSTRTLW